MAERRMFTKKVTDDDNFLSLSASAQALYLHLSMSADDDGFCNQVNISMFKAHASVADLEALLSKRYLYQFENGVIVIKHWRMANALRKDRYTPTAFQEELSRLDVKENGAYTMMVANGLPDGCQMVAERLPQDRLGKDRKGKDRLGEDRIGESKSPRPQKTTYGTYGNVKLTQEEFDRLCTEYGEQETTKAINYLDEYIEEKGYKSKSHNLAIRRWVFDAVKERQRKKPQEQNKGVDAWAEALKRVEERRGAQ